MADDKTERDLLRAREAQALMETPMLANAFRTLREALVNKMINSPIDDPSVREVCRYQLEALDNLALELKHVMETGTLILRKEQQRSEMDGFFDQETDLPH
jgi:hypothetical protein